MLIFVFSGKETIIYNTVGLLHYFISACNLYLK